MLEAEAEAEELKELERLEELAIELEAEELSAFKKSNNPASVEDELKAELEAELEAELKAEELSAFKKSNNPASVEAALDKLCVV